MRFSSEYQPPNRGRKPGSLGKANQLIRNAAPDVVDAVIQKAKSGDITAASLILARAVPPLKATTTAIPINDSCETLSEFVVSCLQAAINGSDPSAVAQLIRATKDAATVIEFDELEQRVAALEGRP